MFDNETIDFVWEHAQVVPNYDSTNIRKDPCGAWILRSQYGNRDSIFGWEIDHVYPLSRGGDDNKSNLRAMQWENNISKSDDFPSYTASITSEGAKNITLSKQYTINENLQKILRMLYSL